MCLTPGGLNNEVNLRGDIQWLGQLVCKVNNDKTHPCKYKEIFLFLQLTAIIK